MRNWLKAFIMIIALLIFSFNSVYAKPVVKTPSPDGQVLTQIEEKRRLIKQLLSANSIIEKQIHDKSVQIDSLLTRLPKYTNISDETIQKKFVPKFENIMNELMDIGTVERSFWKYLKAGNKLAAQKKYSSALKSYTKAAAAVEQKHNLLIPLNGRLEDFLQFLKQLELK